MKDDNRLDPERPVPGPETEQGPMPTCEREVNCEESWQFRLLREREQLMVRIRMLKVHLDDKDAKHNRREWNMLTRQHSAMLEYYYSLTERCKYYGLLPKDPLEDL